MARFTKTLRILLIVFLLLTLLLVYGWSRWQDIKHDMGLTIDWQSLNVGINGVTFKELTISQQSKDGTLITTSSQDVMLSFSTLTIEQLDIKIQQTNYITNDTVKASQTDLQGILNTVSWAPHTILVNQLMVSLPCASGQCLITGKLQLLQKKKPNLPFSLHTTIYSQEQVLELNADLYQKQQQYNLQLTANFNKELLLALNTQVDSLQLQNWQGTFNLYKVNNAQQLFSFLHQWLPNQQIITEIPDAAVITADWQLYFPESTFLKPEKGYFNIDAALPNPWPIIKLGYLEGLLKTRIIFDQYRPRIETLETNLVLTNPAPNLLVNIPKDLQPKKISLKLQQRAIDNQPTQQAIVVYLNTEGAMNTQLTVQTFSNKKAELALTEGLFQADTKKLSIMGYKLQNAKLSLPFSANITPKKTTLNFHKSSLLTIQQLTSKEVSTKKLQLIAKDLKATIDYQNSLRLLVSSPIVLTTTALTQSFLKTISWNITGQLKSDLNQTTFTGKASNGADLSADVSLVTDYKKQLSIKIKTPDLFFRTSNTLAKTFKDWPSLLEIVTGKVNINASIDIPLNNKRLKTNATLKFTGLTGIYDRSEFRDLSGTAVTSLNNNNLKIKLSDLTLTEANPGFNMGPMQFDGEYNTNINTFMHGILNWSKAELSLFTGEVWLKPGQMNLAQLPQEIDVQIKNLQLKDILKAYPTEGLNGEGALDGNLPLIITKSGVNVKQGKLSARKAGFIKFNSPAIKALGENNPSMNLVVGALENFQYSVLSSQISYNQGTAILGLQIKGQNPDRKDAPPVNLNITLQEDIPALLTSLQLSDRVSETIRDRVQKRLQQGASKN